MSFVNAPASVGCHTVKRRLLPAARTAAAVLSLLVALGIPTVLADEADVAVRVATTGKSALSSSAVRHRAADSGRLAQAADDPDERSKAGSTRRIEAAFERLAAGDIVDGTRQMRDALRASDGTNDDALTLRAYTEAAKSFAGAGLVDEADRFFQEGLASRAAKKDSPELALLWLERSLFLLPHGPYEGALSAAIEAKARLEGAFGSESYEALIGADNLSSMLAGHGAVASGLNMAEDTYATALRVLGQAEPLTWRIANNYAEALRLVGVPAAAVPIDTILLERRIEHYGRGSIQALVSASNLALDMLAIGDEPRALFYFRLQRDLGAELADPTSEHVAQAEAWIDYTEAFFHPERPLDAARLDRMASFVGWSGAPDLLRIKAADLAATRSEALGDTNRARALRADAYDIASRAFSPNHPETFQALRAIVLAKVRQDEDDALSSFEDLDRQLFRWMLGEVGTAGNRFVAEATRRLADGILADFASYALADGAAAPAYAKAVLRWKTMDDGERTRLRRLADALPENVSRRLVQSVVRLMGQQQELLSTGRVDAGTHAVLEELGTARRRLAEDRAASKRAMTIPEGAAIDDALAPGDTLIDFVFTERPAAPSQTASAELRDRRLVASVWRKGRPPIVRDLGTVSSVTKLVIARETENEDGQAGYEAMYAALFGPLEAQIEGASRLFLVPDAELFSLPFSRLRGKDGRTLDEMFEVRLLTRADALFFADGRQTLDAGQRLLAAGGLDYRRGSDPGSNPLAFSGLEAESVARIAKAGGLEATLLEGRTGTEPAIRDAVRGIDVVHLATHGFFHKAEDATDPLWRSGLVLARSGTEGEPGADPADGFLYAHELMNWDLSAADLIVLSACETALGDPSRVNSLRGLPTALSIADARRSLLTLWAVSDEGAANFMIRFYEHLAEPGTSYSQALRQTRLEAKTGRIAKAEGPETWAAFVLFEN